MLFLLCYDVQSHFGNPCGRLAKPSVSCSWGKGFTFGVRSLVYEYFFKNSFLEIGSQATELSALSDTFCRWVATLVNEIKHIIGMTVS
jgi:hypothetical protein